MNRGHAIRAGGFTLIETLAVIVLLGITAFIALPALTGTGAARQGTAARQLQRELSYARSRAIATGRTHWVVFSPASEAYSVLAENPAAPGRAGAVAIIDPASGSPFVRRLDVGSSAGVQIVSASFGGGEEVGFDWMGRPLEPSGNVMTTQGGVTLTGDNTVTVEPRSGHVRWQGH